jgi:endonuclease/exonuclease/phosphatase family metal-dependent hydrolase
LLNISRLCLAALVIHFCLWPSFQDKPSKSGSDSQPQVNGESLLEHGRGEQLRSAPPAPDQLKILSFNIRWRGGQELRQLTKLLHEDAQIGGADILGLQEVDRNKKRTQRANTVKLMANELGLYYAWTAPPAAKADEEEATGVAILSPYPLSNIQQIVLPHEGPGRRRRVALGATVTLKDVTIRTYSVHAETRISVERRLEQIRAVLKDLSLYPKGMPAVILGDFNTWQGGSVSKTHLLFKGESFQTPFDDESTFYRKLLFFPLKLKLDWIWLRHLEAESWGIEKRISLSDHWPLWCLVKIKEE